MSGKFWSGFGAGGSLAIAVGLMITGWVGPAHILIIDSIPFWCVTAGIMVVCANMETTS